MKRICVILMPFLAMCTMTYGQSHIVLENDHVRIEFAKRNGSIVSLVDKRSGWNIVPREELGESFQMLVPKDAPGMPIENEIRFNNANGSAQKTAPEVTVKENSVTFRWNKLCSDEVDNLNIAFTGTVSLTDDGLLFSGKVENKSDYVVEYVAWPWFGEFAIPDKPERFWFETKTATKTFYPNFPNESGYWGVDYPTSLAVLPAESFFLLRNNRHGVMISGDSVSDDELLLGSFELIPGYDIAGRWFDEQEVDGEKVRISAKINHISYTKAGEAYSLKPVKMTFFQGDNNYKAVADYAEMMPKPHSVSNWTSAPISWRRVSLSSPGQLVDYASQCSAVGVSALIVKNWYRFVNYAMIEVLPDMYRAIREAYKLGVKVILEDELSKIEYNSPNYGEFKNYLQMDPHGICYENTLMCPLCSKLYNYIGRDYRAAYSDELGAAGFLCIDPNSRWRTSYCYGENHGHKSPTFIAPGVASLDRDFAEAARKANPDYLVGGSYMLDSQTKDFDFIYLNSAPRSAMTRILNPDASIVAAINIRYSREDINTCLLNRYSICYEDLAGTDDLQKYPNVLSYASAIDALRAKYRDYLWDAEFLLPDGVAVKGNVNWSLYRNRNNGKRAVVLVNYDTNFPASVEVFLDGCSGFNVVSAENPELSESSSKVLVSRLSSVILIEK